jgi:hypothetical protein
MVAPVQCQLHRRSRLLDLRPRRPTPKTHENHEPPIHDFAMRHFHPLRRINTVPADGLPVQQAAASELTSQEKHDDMGKTDRN